MIPERYQIEIFVLSIHLMYWNSILYDEYFIVKKHFNMDKRSLPGFSVNIVACKSI